MNARTQKSKHEKFFCKQYINNIHFDQKIGRGRVDIYGKL